MLVMENGKKVNHEYLKKLVRPKIKTAKPEVKFYFPYEDISVHDLKMENEYGEDVFENVSEILFHLHSGDVLQLGINEVLTRQMQVKITEDGLAFVKMMQLYTPEIEKEEF